MPTQTSITPFNSLSRDHLAAEDTTPFGIAIRTFNSLSRDHKRDPRQLLAWPQTFNSLSRDHLFLCQNVGQKAGLGFQLPLSGSQHPELLVLYRMRYEYATFQLPLSGSPFSGVHSSFHMNIFQLPLSGSPAKYKLTGNGPWLRAFNSLSRDHQFHS